QALCALPAEPGAASAFVAADYDQLVDAPIFAGSPLVQSFVESGKEVLVVTEGADARWPQAQALQDVQRLVRTQRHLWGELPFARYIFFNLLVEGYGGLEHRDCAVLMASGWAARSRKDYLEWLGLVSHEFFHLWNIKRLRPVELGPFNYEAENPTPSLWIAEGFTAYYDDLLVHRAGLCSREEYLGRLGRAIERLHQSPGRLVQPLAEASFDAWIKFYRRDENSDNATVNYYLKGSVVAFLLDAKIRLLTGGRQSLDEVMRLALQRFAHGYTQSAFTALCDQVAGASLAPFFHCCVDTATEVDLGEALAYYGLGFGGGDAAAAAPAGSLGIVPRLDGGRLWVAEVRRGGAAWEAGLQPDDELLGIDAWRIAPTRFVERLRSFAPGSRLSLLVARRERLARLPVTLGADSQAFANLSFVPQPSAAQRQARDGWLGALPASP
ncbi:MAG: M61 family peptidase, partial [Deltaproteobacteria bacterium]